MIAAYHTDIHPDAYLIADQPEDDAVDASDLRNLKVMVIDLAPFTLALAQALRSLGPSVEVVALEEAVAWRRNNDIGAMIICGGTQKIHEGPEIDECLYWDMIATNGDNGSFDCVPQLFIGYPARRFCYEQMSGQGIQRTTRPPHSEYAQVRVLHGEPSILFHGIDMKELPVRLATSDLICKVPDTLRIVARVVHGGSIAAAEDPHLGQYYIDFLPHSMEADVGLRILENFLTEAITLRGVTFPVANPHIPRAVKRSLHPDAQGWRNRRRR